jgi:hypothetical protein
MKSLLVALGILVCFGILYWLDRYYKKDGEEKDGGRPDSPGSDGDEPESDSETI